MANDFSKTLKLLSFLQEMEKKKSAFTVEDVIRATGYKKASVTTYIGKRLLDYIVFAEKNGEYKVTGALKLTEDNFKSHMTQKSGFVVKHKRKLEDRLLEKSLDAYLLAIEIYNRPTQRNRIEAFCIMTINAWELLFKAEICRTFGEQAIYYKRQPDKSLAIKDALAKCIPNDHSPVRKNLEFLIELRDKAIHLLLPELQTQLSRIFQSTVLNYLKCYASFAGRNPIDLGGSGLISMVVDVADVGKAVMKKNYGPATTAVIEEFFKRLADAESKMNSLEFSIPIEYKLTLTKGLNRGDISLAAGTDGKAAVLVEVPKRIEKTHPWRQKDVMKELKRRLPKEIAEIFTARSFQAILYKEKFRSSDSNEYYHLITNPTTHRYSERLIDFIYDKLIDDPDYVDSCKESYTNYIKKKGKN